MKQFWKFKKHALAAAVCGVALASLAGSAGAVALSPTSVGILTFNTPVNWIMYQDLQRAQFPSGHPSYDNCNPAGANYLKSRTTGLATNFKDINAYANSEECMPSLSGQEIRSIFMHSGAVRSAGDFIIESPYKSGTFVNMTANATTTAPAVTPTDNTIQICRRVKGSGTQASFNAIIIGYPCDPNGVDSSTDTLTPEGYGSFTKFVTENEGAGDVEKCLNDFNNGTNTSGANTVANTGANAPYKRWAIGLQSLDKNANLANDYRFIKIDGFAPTIDNVHAGDYYYFAQQSLQYATGASQNVVDAYNNLVSSLQDPALLATLNQQHGFGKAPWLALPTSTNLPTALLDYNTPIGWYQRISAGGKYNTCALPSAYKRTSAQAGLTTGHSGGVTLIVNPQNCTSNGGADGQCTTGPN